MYLENYAEKFVCNVYIVEKYKVIGKEMGFFREFVFRYK